jgi:hypothetical protein
MTAFELPPLGREIRYAVHLRRSPNAQALAQARLGAAV